MFPYLLEAVHHTVPGPEYYKIPLFFLVYRGAVNVQLDCSLTNIISNHIKRYWKWIKFHLAAEEQHIYYLLWEMPWSNKFQSSLNKCNFTSVMRIVSSSGDHGGFSLELKLLFHSQAPTDTFHRGSPSALLPKHNLFHIVCKPKSVTQIALQPQRFSAVSKGGKTPLLKVPSQVTIWVIECTGYITLHVI